MKLPALLVSDLHLTASPKDEYRWALFPWLAQQCAKWEVQTLCILGDLTDAKDYHSAELVNRVVASIQALKACAPRIIILMGNHDYLRAGHAFFSFLSTMPGVTFVTQPLDTSAEGESCLFLPHTRTPAKDWADYDFSHYQYVFMHQTVKGSKASNGMLMDGEQLPDLSAAGKVWSGDIHVPQTIGCVEYVGSPYHVHFGDRFRPRCIVLDRRTEVIRFPSISRLAVTVDSFDALKALRLNAGDQIKLSFNLQRSEVHGWRDIRRAADDYLRSIGAEVHGIELVVPKTTKRVRVGHATQTTATPADIVQAFVEREDLGAESLDVAIEVLDATR